MNWAPPFGFLGNIGLGLYYFNARWYDPELGRFISEDPARDGGNWYEYCRDNPLKHTDPSGLQAIVPPTLMPPMFFGEDVAPTPPEELLPKIGKGTTREPKAGLPNEGFKSWKYLPESPDKLGPD